MGELIGQLGRDIPEQPVVAERVGRSRADGMDQREQHGFDRADAAIDSARESERLIERFFLGSRSLVEPVLPRDQRDQNHEGRDCGKNERHETQPQAVSVRTLRV